MIMQLQESWTDLPSLGIFWCKVITERLLYMQTSQWYPQLSCCDLKRWNLAVKSIHFNGISKHLSAQMISVEFNFDEHLHVGLWLPKGNKQKAILAYLILDKKHLHKRTVIYRWLWERSPVGNGANLTVSKLVSSEGFIFWLYYSIKCFTIVNITRGN